MIGRTERYIDTGVSLVEPISWILMGPFLMYYFYKDLKAKEQRDMFEHITYHKDNDKNHNLLDISEIDNVKKLKYIKRI